MNDESIIVTTRYHEHALAQENVEQILGTDICRVVGAKSWLAKSGFYDRYFLCRNQRQGIHHRFRNPYDALLQTVHARDWEGISPAEIPDGEKQRVANMLARHGYLHLLLTDELTTVSHSARKKEFEKNCAELAEDIGKPHDELKQQILGLTLLAADPENKEAATALQEAMLLDRQRLYRVEAIGDNLNWRAALISAVILEQQELMTTVSRSLNALQLQHRSREHGQPVESLDRAADHIQTLLRGAKDRPFRGLAQWDVHDLREYRLALYRHDFTTAYAHLQRPLVAHSQFGFNREIQVVLYRIALGKGRRGARRGELFDTVHAKLIELQRSIAPESGDILRRNPLYRTKGLIGDAIHVIRSPNRDWREVKELLHQAAATFGG